MIAPDHPSTGKHPRGKGPRTKRAKRRRNLAAEARRVAEVERLQAARKVTEVRTVDPRRSTP